MESKPQPADANATAKSVPTIEFKDNDPLFEKCHVTIRCKPLGKGQSDVNDHGTDKKSNKIYDSANNEKKIVTFKDVKLKKEQTYKFPDLVATQEFDNEALYN